MEYTINVIIPDSDIGVAELLIVEACELLHEQLAESDIALSDAAQQIESW